jgi:hypothetical protein
MSYVIYEKSSTFIMGPYTARREVLPDHRKTYKTMAAAKAALTRWTKWWQEDIGDLDAPENNPTFRYAIAETEYFHKNIEKQVKKRNLLTDEEFMEPANRPYYCSPSSETYWSM